MADKPAVPRMLARYVGHTPFRMPRQFGPVTGLDPQTGKEVRVDGKLIGKGDVVLMPVREVVGQTMWHDPKHLLDSEDLGPGHVVKPEHAALSEEEARVIGYEFHEGSPWWRDVNAPDPDEEWSASASASTSTPASPPAQATPKGRANATSPSTPSTDSAAPDGSAAKE